MDLERKNPRQQQQGTPSSLTGGNDRTYFVALTFLSPSLRPSSRWLRCFSRRPPAGPSTGSDWIFTGSDWIGLDRNGSDWIIRDPCCSPVEAFLLKVRHEHELNKIQNLESFKESLSSGFFFSKPGSAASSPAVETVLRAVLVPPTRLIGPFTGSVVPAVLGLKPAHCALR